MSSSPLNKKYTVHDRAASHVENLILVEEATRSRFQEPSAKGPHAPSSTMTFGRPILPNTP